MGRITVIGLGTEQKDLTLRAAELLRSGAQVILHTARCGAADYLAENGVAYASLDDLYERYEDFDEHAEAAAEAVRLAAEKGDVLYGVMDVRDASACLLAEEGATVIPGVPCEGALFARVRGQAQVFSASEWETVRLDAACFALVREIDSKELACEVKLRLMEAYPDDERTLVLRDGAVSECRLYELDRLDGYDHRFAALICPEEDLLRWNDCGLRDLMDSARRSDAFYRAGDPDRLAESAALIAGAAAYAEDRGEFSLSDILLDARELLER